MSRRSSSDRHSRQVHAEARDRTGARRLSFPTATSTAPRTGPCPSPPIRRRPYSRSFSTGSRARAAATGVAEALMAPAPSAAGAASSHTSEAAAARRQASARLLRGRQRRLRMGAQERHETLPHAGAQGRGREPRRQPARQVPRGPASDAGFLTRLFRWAHRSTSAAAASASARESTLFMPTCSFTRSARSSSSGPNARREDVKACRTMFDFDNTACARVPAW